MIVEAHVRHRRHVLTTRDERALLRHGRRERLEKLGNTWIRTADEFAAMRHAALGNALLLVPPLHSL